MTLRWSASPERGSPSSTSWTLGARPSKEEDGEAVPASGQERDDERWEGPGGVSSTLKLTLRPRAPRPHVDIDSVDCRSRLVHEKQIS